MLLRDLKRARVIEDIITWITNPIAKLPSGADQNPIERLKAAAH
jgi:hypothetical protein